MRALMDGGFADLHRPQAWNLDFVRSDSQRKEYQDIVDRILDGLEFLKTIHAGADPSALKTVSMHTSHEGCVRGGLFLRKSRFHSMTGMLVTVRCPSGQRTVAYNVCVCVCVCVC